MKKGTENNPREKTLLQIHPTYIKKKSQQPERWCCFLIVVMLFAGGLASSVCKAATNEPEIRVGSELDFPPYALADENGRPDGFSVELIKAITGAMGLSIKISTGSWDTVWNALVAGQLDVLPIVAKTPGRQRLIDFSLPHTETYDAFFVRKGDPPIQNIAAAQGKEIVVMRSDAAHHELLTRNFPGKLILVDTIPEGLKLISSGKHNAFLCSKLIGTLSIKNHGLTGLTAGPTIPDYKRVFSFGVKKGDTELLEKLNQGLLIVKTNGEYDRIYDKWLTFDDPWLKAKKYLLPAVTILIAIVLLAGFWLVMLQRLVRKRTHELSEKNKMLYQAHENLEIRVRERTAELAQSNQSLLNEITERKQAEAALVENHTKLERNLKGVIEVISETIEAKGPYPSGHHRQVSALTTAIAREMGLTNFQIEGIELASAVYDIGLMNIPIEFLQDTERLKGNILTLYQGYPQTGHDTLKKIEFPWPIADIILQHRECFDGSGFPQGIKGEEILVEARILAVAHALEDLTTNRSFRNAFPVNEALEELSSHSGSMYDPEVVAACLRLFREKGFKFE